MKNEIQVNSIGSLHAEKGSYYIKVKDEYKLGLTSLDGFSHLQILWWGNLTVAQEDRNRLVNERPYKTSPDQVGVFATRSQFRPNPLLITTVYVEKIDFKKGIIFTPYLDAENDTPLLDIKPYHLYERVEHCTVPEWCNHWPTWAEEAAHFDWEAEFNF